MNEILNTLVQTTHFAIFAKMLLAMLLGVAIGLERELKHKPVGVKTCTIISVTTCVLTIVSIQAAEHYAQVSENIRTDPMRLAAQVVSGIGFLGAGVILRKSNDAISGLTTAAIIWAAAGIGIAVGASFFFDAIIATLMILAAVRISPILQSIIHHKHRKKKTKLNIQLRTSTAIATITDVLIKNDYNIENINIKDQSNGEVKLHIRCQSIEKSMLQEIFQLLKNNEDVLNVELES